MFYKMGLGACLVTKIMAIIVLNLFALFTLYKSNLDIQQRSLDWQFVEQKCELVCG